MTPPRVLGLIGGDPFDRATWSGASHHLFRALQASGGLIDALDARPPGLMRPVAKVAAFSPRSMRRWRERYELSPVTRAASSIAGGVRARRRCPSPDALLQIGAYYDFSRMPGLRPRLRCSFHDANLALLARERFEVEEPTARHIRKTMAAEQRVFDRLDLIMTMSDWLRDSFIADFAQDPAKVVTVGSGANIVSIPTPPDRHDRSAPRFLFVGFDWERKGGPDLLAGFRMIRGDHPEAELWIVGPERRAEPEPGVTWFGGIDRRSPAGDAEMARLHAEATAYVMPSIYDPCPNVFFEAMAWALPCVGSDRCSMPEVIDAPATGLIVPARTPPAVAEALDALARDPGRAAAMGAAGRARFLERYTWDHVTARMIDAISVRLGTAPGA